MSEFVYRQDGQKVVIVQSVSNWTGQRFEIVPVTEESDDYILAEGRYRKDDGREFDFNSWRRLVKKEYYAGYLTRELLSKDIPFEQVNSMSFFELCGIELQTITGCNEMPELEAAQNIAEGCKYE